VLSLCQSGQDPKEVNELLEAVLDGYWPLEIRDAASTTSEEQKLANIFELNTSALGLVHTWAEWEEKYDERFGDEACTRELDKFFLIKTIVEWDK